MQKMKDKFLSERIRLTIELEIDGDFGQNSKDESEREWFKEHLLRDELLLHSNLVGATIGGVKVLSQHCQWVYDEDMDAYETECGHAFTLIDGTPAENHMKYCAYCGQMLLGCMILTEHPKIEDEHANRASANRNVQTNG